jgi:hypothetical protein
MVAKVNDIIKVTNGGWPAWNDAVGIVKAVNMCNITVDFFSGHYDGEDKGHHEWFVNFNAFEIIHSANNPVPEPEPPAARFKVGDLVQVTQWNSDYYKFGACGLVAEDRGADRYTVRFIAGDFEHSCGDRGTTWHIHANGMKLLRAVDNSRLGNTVIDDLMEVASDAFWAAIVEELPMIEHGDFDPGQCMRWDESCREAVEGWLMNNLPTEVK